MVLTITIFIVDQTTVDIISYNQYIYCRSNDSRYHFSYNIDDQTTSLSFFYQPSITINVTLKLLVIVETTTLDLIN